jgi:hypothetical protein
MGFLSSRGNQEETHGWVRAASEGASCMRIWVVCSICGSADRVSGYVLVYCIKYMYIAIRFFKFVWYF